MSRSTSGADCSESVDPISRSYCSVKDRVLTILCRNEVVGRADRQSTSADRNSSSLIPSDPISARHECYLRVPKDQAAWRSRGMDENTPSRAGVSFCGYHRRITSRSRADTKDRRDQSSRDRELGVGTRKLFFGNSDGFCLFPRVGAHDDGKVSGFDRGRDDCSDGARSWAASRHAE